MEELAITDISIEDVEFSIDEAIDFKISIDDFESPRIKYLFNWNEVSENYYIEFINLLANRFDIGWDKKSVIKKIDNDITRVFTQENDLLLRLNDEKTEVSLIMGDVEIDKFVAKNEKGNVNIYDDLFKSYKENPDELLSQSPNQKIVMSLRNNSSFELDDDYIELLESVFYELGFRYKNLKITSLRDIDSRTYECEIYIRVDGDEKKDHNRKIRNEFNKLTLLRGFQAITTRGNTFYSDIPIESLGVTPKKMDLRIITKLLEEDYVTYFCFSDLIFRKLIEVINEKEYQSVQIDISDYVAEIEYILDKQPFMKLCTNQYKSIINNEMRNMRSQNYRGVAKLWNAIENILSKIAEDSGYSGISWSLNKRVNYLTNDYKILSEETKGLIKALARNQQAHGRLNRPDHDHKYFAILWMKAIRDIYLDWCCFQSIDLCFAEMASDLDFHIDDVREIYGIRIRDRQDKKKTKKIILKEYPTGINCAEDWESDIRIQLQFENQSSNQKVNFNFNVNLISESIISSKKEILS